MLLNAAPVWFGSFLIPQTERLDHPNILRHRRHVITNRLIGARQPSHRGEPDDPINVVQSSRANPRFGYPRQASEPGQELQRGIGRTTATAISLSRQVV